MTNKLAVKALNRAIKFVLFQLLLIVMMATVFLVIDDKSAASSAFLGGMIYVLPNYIFTRFAFRYMGARQAKEVASSFSLGGTLKLILTVVLFIAVLSLVDVKYLPLYLTFALVILSQVLTPYFINK